MSRFFYQNLCAFLLFCFMFFLVAWEGVIAPLRPEGSWLILKVLPLCFPFLGILKGRKKSFQQLSLILQLYFLESLVRIFDAFPINVLAWIEFLFALILFITLVLFLKAKF